MGVVAEVLSIMVGAALAAGDSVFFVQNRKRLERVGVSPPALVRREPLENAQVGTPPSPRIPKAAAVSMQRLSGLQ